MSASMETLNTRVKQARVEDGSHAWLGLLLMGVSSYVTVRVLGWAGSAVWMLVIQ